MGNPVKDPVCGMAVDETTAIKFNTGKEFYYFCSKHCLEKFIKENKISQDTFVSCPSEPTKFYWYKNKTVVTACILVFICVLSYILPILGPFKKFLYMYFKKIWLAILSGLVLGGVIDYFIPREYISYILAKPKKVTILYSVLLGFFMSACSHGILALSIQLHKKGASNPAVVAFLLASPWANFPVTIMLIGLFGLKGLYIISCALLVAILTGFVYQFLDSRGLIEHNKNTITSADGFSVWGDIKEKFKLYHFSRQQLGEDIKGIINGSVSLADMVLWWILIGISFASMAAAYIPQNIFRAYMGPTIIGMLVTLLVATIMEVCSEGTAPLAFEIYRQTGAIGNAFVFLMAGVITDYTEIGLLWHNVGRKVAIWLPIITVPQVVALGLLANRLFR